MHDWEGARDFYIKAGWRNGVTLEDAANRFDIPYQSVRRRAAKEQWRLIRKWQEVDDTCKTLDEFIYYYE